MELLAGMGPRHLVRIYRRSLGAHLRAVLEYQADFWLLIVAGMLTQLIGVIFIGALFTKVTEINGWRFADTVLIYGMASLAAGAAPLLSEGLWRLPFMVNKGDLDYQLVRPYPAVLQVMSTAIGLHGAGDLLGAGSLLAWALWHASVRWSAGTILMGLLLLISAVVIRISIDLASNSTAFWLLSPNVVFALSVFNIGELARYPITVYGMGLRVLLSGVLPFAFITFFPAAWLLDHGRLSWVGLFTPLVALYCVGVAMFVFRRGLRRYESAGN